MPIADELRYMKTRLKDIRANMLLFYYTLLMTASLTMIQILNWEPVYIQTGLAKMTANKLSFTIIL